MEEERDGALRRRKGAEGTPRDLREVQASTRPQHQREGRPGGVAGRLEVAFLEEAIDEASRAKPLVDRHPEFQAVYAHAVRLYDEITVQALKNEQRGNWDTSER